MEPKVFFDSKEYKKEDFSESFDFLLKHGLILFKDEITYKVAFVGEVITPFSHFISLPKNFNTTSDCNIDLIRKMLKRYKNTVREGKTIVYNKSYVSGEEISSNLFYWRKLLSYFLDYITYEFYYPKKRIIKHKSTSQQGRLMPMMTEINRDRYGRGLTFELKNFSENDYIKKVYYSTLKDLEKLYASSIEKKQILEIENYLFKKNIIPKDDYYEPVNINEFLLKAKSIQTNAIHEVIVNTLINYYKDSKFKEKNTINVFYSKNFEYIYQYLLQRVLLHDKKKRNSNWIEPSFKGLDPDIINKDFIGDAKYYNITDDIGSEFTKELYAYNVANNNSQPNFVFIPSENTYEIKTLTHDRYSLRVVSLSLSKVFDDFESNNTKFETLNYVHKLIGI